MEEIKRCKRCITPGTLPGITFDRDGICSYCRNHDKLFSNWGNTRAQRKREFEDILGRAKRLRRNYDCLILLSGGKDSTYALYLCDKVYKLKCLCVTFDNGFLSDYAKANIENAIKMTNADHIFYKINRKLLLELYKSFLIKCGNFCPVCMSGIRTCAQIISKNFRIPLVINGGGRRISYLGIIPELFQGGDLFFFRSVMKGDPLEKNVRPMLLGSSFWYIQKIAEVICKILKIKNISPDLIHKIAIFDYLDTSRAEIYNILRKEMDWKAPQEPEHMDCLLHEIPFYTHTLKFPDLTPTTLYHSGLIRLGEMTRDEAMEIETKKLENRQTPIMLDSFLKEIDMKRDEFESYVKDWRKINKFRDKKINFIRRMYKKIVKF
ncbi:MAG: hypothetical protein PHQ96_07485 [Candidatus Omnitrophica bacterium]|nr:hypothetical protein [Candidatus Omnitrophota bacterium]